jgi:hypothetical protein
MVSARKLRVSPENTRPRLSRLRIFHTSRSHRADRQSFIRRMVGAGVRNGWSARDEALTDLYVLPNP